MAKFIAVNDSLESRKNNNNKNKTKQKFKFLG